MTYEDDVYTPSWLLDFATVTMPVATIPTATIPTATIPTALAVFLFELMNFLDVAICHHTCVLCPEAALNCSVDRAFAIQVKLLILSA